MHCSKHSLIQTLILVFTAIFLILIWLYYVTCEWKDNRIVSEVSFVRRRSMRLPSVALCANEPLNRTAMRALRDQIYPYANLPVQTDRQLLLEMMAPRLAHSMNVWNRDNWEKDDLLRRAMDNFETSFNNSGRNLSYMATVLSKCEQLVRECRVPMGNGASVLLNASDCCDELFAYVPTSIGVCAKFDFSRYNQSTVGDGVPGGDTDAVELTLNFDSQVVYNAASAKMLAFFAPLGGVAFGSLVYDDAIVMEPRQSYDIYLEQINHRRIHMGCKKHHKEEEKKDVKNKNDGSELADAFSAYEICFIGKVRAECRCRLLADLWSLPNDVNDRSPFCGPNDTDRCVRPLLKQYGWGHIHQHRFLHRSTIEQEEEEIKSDETKAGVCAEKMNPCQFTELAVVYRRQQSLNFDGFRLRVAYDWLGVKHIYERKRVEVAELVDRAIFSAGFFLALFLCKVLIVRGLFGCICSSGSSGSDRVAPARNRAVDGTDEPMGARGKSLPPLTNGEKLQGTQTD